MHAKLARLESRGYVFQMIDAAAVLDKARHSFPHPIANAIRSFEFENDPLRRYDRLMAATEKLIIWLGATGLAWAKEEDAGIGESWISSLNSSGISIGTWFRAACDAEKAMSLTSAALGGFQQALQARPKGRGPRGKLDAFIGERNRRAHGGEPKSSVEARARLNDLEPAFAEAIDGLDFLGHVQWFLPTRLRYRSSDKDFQVTAFLFVGDHPTLPTTSFITPVPLAENEIYLENTDGTLLSLAPFIVTADCETCYERETFYPSKKLATRAQLVSFDRGHGYSDPELDSRLDLALATEPRLGPQTRGQHEMPPPNGKWTWEDYARWSKHPPEKMRLVKTLAERILAVSGWVDAKSKNQISFRHENGGALQLQFWAATPRISSPNIRSAPTEDLMPGLMGRQVEGSWVWDVPDAQSFPSDITGLIEAAQGTPAEEQLQPREGTESQFESGMQEGYQVLKDFDYQANRFLIMLREFGAVATAKRLLEPREQHSFGFLKLVEIDKLEWSVEAYVLRPQFRHLFTESELQEARRRLRAADFDVDRWEERPWQR